MQGIVTKMPDGVCVATGARLHMGFIDLNGGLGRRFGSIGLALDKPATRIQAWRDQEFLAEGPMAGRALACATKFTESTGITGGVRLQIDEAIPEHAGLGSGTQMALAVGTAIARLYNLPVTVRDIAALTGRGARSGIGVGAFETGGFLLDGGRGLDTVVPPIIARMDFPTDWRVLLIFDQHTEGVHGPSEISAFNALPKFSAAQTAHIARLVLMQALPAVAENNLNAFGSAVSELQRLIGDHFAPAQGGGRYISPIVADVMKWLEAQGVCCVGQSSWGPTGFAVVGSEIEATQLLQNLNDRNADGYLSFSMCQARNAGSHVETTRMIG